MKKTTQTPEGLQAVLLIYLKALSTAYTLPKVLSLKASLRRLTAPYRSRRQAMPQSHQLRRIHSHPRMESSIQPVQPIQWRIGFPRLCTMSDSQPMRTSCLRCYVSRTGKHKFMLTYSQCSRTAMRRCGPAYARNHLAPNTHYLCN